MVIKIVVCVFVYRWLVHKEKKPSQYHDNGEYIGCLVSRDESCIIIKKKRKSKLHLQREIQINGPFIINNNNNQTPSIIPRQFARFLPFVLSSVFFVFFGTPAFNYFNVFLFQIIFVHCPFQIIHRHMPGHRIE